MAAESLVALDGLVVHRGTFTLDIPHWEVGPGQVVGIVGPNGAGKTTLLESVAGLRPVDAGSVRVFGLDPWRQPELLRAALGFMSDDMPLFAMPIGRLMRTLSGYYATWDPELVERLLTTFDLNPAQRVGQLSRGQGTRLRLITAMAFRPRVLVLDEPAAGPRPGRAPGACRQRARRCASWPSCPQETGSVRCSLAAPGTAQHSSIAQRRRPGRTGLADVVLLPAFSAPSPSTSPTVAGFRPGRPSPARPCSR